ncbi:DUF2264 domain-containing protein [Arthrobacter antibioticus]|uniref:DUF2264 domain-containing protein n=1 Tax=Arthrobacter sp. H35-MC1 TaxID=3046203 RepID=UPI0024BA627E|nr:DUF2264 domain-containing protein [Arthrobacter sp. H35-MC1]MDJ0317443.1 DUF2264 domain-containing protein [Arthrobacter sp. H35-MC1]
MNWPSPDWAQAPFTGLSRAHWEAAADEQIAAAKRYSSPRGAQVHFPSVYEQSPDELLEGFARTFLLAALRLSGAAGDGGQAAEVMAQLAQWYAQALDAGTDPSSDERWPKLTAHSQTTVEATAVALGLHLSRKWIWAVVPQRVRDNTAAWLGDSAQSFGADNNHVMFPATIQAFLGSAGYAYDGAGIEAALARIEDWYVGDGWYSDGEGRRFDHYNAWTFHVYPFFILDLLGEDAATGRRKVYRDRLGQFVHGYSHLFGANGAPLIQGRSLLYRWGVAAPFWMAMREGITVVSPGQTRRIASGVLKYFLDGGAAPDGVLTLGWHETNSSILQSYNAPGSPQWAAKGFLGLLLPADHPVWTEQEQPLPVEQGDYTLPMSGPGWLAVGTAATGTVRVLNAGSDGHPQKDDPLYRRLAFSTSTVPWLEPGSGERDNDIFIRHDGSSSRHRGLHGGSVRSGGGSSTFALDAAGRDVLVQNSFAVLDGVEVRAAKLTGVVGLTPALSGYLCSTDAAPETLVNGGGAQVGIKPGALSSVLLLEATAEAEPHVVHGEGTILGAHSGLPLLQFPPLASNELTLMALIGLDVTLARLRSMALELQWQWAPDGVQLRFRNRTVVLPWQRKATWPADSINQGVFRWNPPEN